MATAGVLLVGLVILTPTVMLGVMYWQYQSWPPAVWRKRVSRWAKALRTRRDRLRHSDGTKIALAALLDDHFGRYLRTIPLEALDAHPGIGPATIARLRNEGYRDLGAITNLRFEAIVGFGPTRATALCNAVRALVREARSRFEAGACPEAQDYHRRAAALHAAAEQEARARARELTAIDRVLRETEQLHELARDVTFWEYLFHGAAPGVTDEVMNRPLPEVVVPPAPSTPHAPPVPVVAPVAVAKLALSPPTPALLAAPPGEPQPSAAAHPALSQMWAFARFGFVAARSDGRVAQAERKVIRSFLAARFGHNDALARHIDPLMEQVEAAVPTEAEALAEVQAVATEPERGELYRFAEQIADATGERKSREREALERIALALGVVISQTAPVLPKAPELSPPVPVPKPVTDPRVFLEIAPDTALSPELIRRRFAMLTAKLDLARAREMGPEFAQLAEEKAARMRAAAESLIAAFNEPLEKPVAPPPADPRHNPDLDDVFGG